jgi:Zn-dependent peptidase ImmA (M78 family)
VRLQELLGQTDEASLPVQTLEVDRVEDAEAAAMSLREQWNLGVDPIANMIDLLEHHFVHVIEIEAGDKFDGLSAVVRDQEQRVRAAAVVTRRGIPGERQRLNLAHELGHLALKVREGEDQERVAFRFGAAFLAPSVLIEQEVGRRRALIQVEELLLLKRRFGMSVQALLFRLRDLHIITDSYYRQWCIDINRLGWRKREPFELPAEQPQWMRQGALRAVAEGIISKEEAEAMIGDRIAADVPLPVIERRAFMNLPLEERRRLLAEQATRLADHYAQDAEWRELGEGDLVAY